MTQRLYDYKSIPKDASVKILLIFQTFLFKEYLTDVMYTCHIVMYLYLLWNILWKRENWLKITTIDQNDLLIHGWGSFTYIILISLG